MNQSGIIVRQCSIRVKIGNFLSRMSLKFDGWPWNKIGHLLYVTSSLVHHFIMVIGEFKLELQSGNAKFRSKFVWKIDGCFLCEKLTVASFRSHLWILTGVTVRKCPNWGKICFYLWNHDLWSWAFVWTSHLLVVINPEDFMMIRMRKKCHRRTDKTILGAAWNFPLLQSSEWSDSGCKVQSMTSHIYWMSLSATPLQTTDSYNSNFSILF